MKHLDIKGIRVPALGFGTFQLTGAACRRAVATALGLGYRHIDTARMYGNEAEVGAGLRESGVAREEIFLTTKVWHDSLAYGDAKRSAEASLRALDMPYVDLLLVHWPSRAVPLGDTLRAFAELRAEGKARSIGVSNFPVALLREAVETHGADLLCDQVEYHVLLSQRPLLAYLRAQRMMLTAYAPLAKGRLVANPLLVEIGRAHGKSAAQVALRWLLDQDGVAAIPKAAGEARMRENLESLELELTAAERARLDALAGAGRTIDPAWAPTWDPA